MEARCPRRAFVRLARTGSVHPRSPPDTTLWSEAYWTILREYARLMGRSGQNTFWMRWPDFFNRDGDRWRLDEQRLDRYIRTFLEAGLVRIEGAPIARRPGGDWSNAELELSMIGLPAESEAGLASLRDLADQLRRFMEERGWMNRWIQHIADEPTDVNAKAYSRLSSRLSEMIPGVPIIEATMSRELIGAVDIWCPQVHKYQQNRDFFLERQAEGDQVWTYVCLVPGGPWLNRLDQRPDRSYLHKRRNDSTCRASSIGGSITTRPIRSSNQSSIIRRCPVPPTSSRLGTRMWSSPGRRGHGRVLVWKPRELEWRICPRSGLCGGSIPRRLTRWWAASSVDTTTGSPMLASTEPFALRCSNDSLTRERQPVGEAR